MKYKFLLTFYSLLLAASQLMAQQTTPKVLVMTLDGMNANVWESAYTPNIDMLIKNATYTYNGLTLGPAYNATTWSSVLTGVWPEKHKVEDETYAGNDFATYPHFFDYFEANGIKTASITRDASIATQIPSDISYKATYSTDDQVIAEAAAYIKDNAGVGAFFVQIDQALRTAETEGFDARRAEYLKAIQYYDEQVGDIIEAVTQRSGYANENWMIVLTTNHGGNTDGTYGGNTREETTPFIIFSGDYVRNRQFLLDILTAEKGKDNAVFLRPGLTEYVKIKKTGTKLDDMADFTVELRVKPKDATSDPVIIGDKDWGSGGNPGWLLSRRGSKWKFNIANQTRSRRDINLGDDANIEDDLWHHIALSFDKDKEAVCYTDGREVGRGNMGYEDSDSFKSPYENLVLGQDGTLEYPTAWKGVIDEVRIFNKVIDSLTLVTWKDEKNIENRHPDWEHVIGYWKLDESEGTKVEDYSGNGYNGVTVGTKRVPANGAITHVDIAPTLMAHMGVTISDEWGLDGGVVDLIIPNIVLGTDREGFRTKDVSVYPNPASDRLNFQFAQSPQAGQDITLSVYNMQGEVIRQEKLTTGYNNISLDVSSHQRGYYMYHIQGSNFSYKGKFIIKN